MDFDNRLFILLGIAAIFAGARLLYEGIRAMRKRYFRLSLGRLERHQTFRGKKARRIGAPVSLLGVLLVIGGFRLITEYKTYSLIELAVVLGIASVLIAWAVIEMTRFNH